MRQNTSSKIKGSCRQDSASSNEFIVANNNSSPAAQKKSSSHGREEVTVKHSRIERSDSDAEFLYVLKKLKSASAEINNPEYKHLRHKEPIPASNSSSLIFDFKKSIHAADSSDVKVDCSSDLLMSGAESSVSKDFVFLEDRITTQNVKSCESYPSNSKVCSLGSTCSVTTSLDPKCSREDNYVSQLCVVHASMTEDSNSDSTTHHPDSEESKLSKLSQRDELSSTYSKVSPEENQFATKASTVFPESAEPNQDGGTFKKARCETGNKDQNTIPETNNKRTDLLQHLLMNEVILI